MRWIASSITLISSISLCAELLVTYVIPGAVALHLESFEVEEVDIRILFDLLSNPPHGYLSYVPPGVLRMHFEFDKTLVLDIDGDRLKGLSFEGERFFLYQVLSSIFLNFDFERVRFIENGSPSNVLVEYVDTRFSFDRVFWFDWLDGIIHR